MHNNSQRHCYMTTCAFGIPTSVQYLCSFFQSKTKTIFHLNYWICIGDWDQRLFITKLV